MAKLSIRFSIGVLAGCLVAVAECSAARLADKFREVVFGSPSVDLSDFERFAARARQSGATHINITAEDLPWSFWQYDTPGDPYPAWVISNAGLLKIAPPPALQPHIPRDYSEKILGILEVRCKILRRLGLKAAFTTFEPQMLPEAVFAEHPLWRGARVDHPSRSRVARFAPTVDNPEVLALYREAMMTLVRRCPEIDVLSMRTNDSGAGLDWSGGLYSGRLGNTLYQSRPMDRRFRDFYAALQQGAIDAGGRLEVDMYNTKEPDPARLAASLSRGMAVDNFEGPGGTPYKAEVEALLVYRDFYHPVLGIPRPVPFLEGLEAAGRSAAPRLLISIPDRLNRELYFRVYDRFRQAPTNDEISRLTLLKEVATQEVGSRNAGALLSLWLNLGEASRTGSLLTSGGAIVYQGCVQQRWVTRPLVPFPGELKPEEKEYYRKFQFQARGEEHADNLVDLQANEVYAGWSGRYFVNRILGEAEARLGRARSLAGQLGDTRLTRRLDVFRCLLRNARNAVSYQAQLDRARALGLKPESRPVVSTQSSWDRQMMLETARAEIDNTAVLIDLLKPGPGSLIQLAATKTEEDIRVLGPDLVEQLQKKIALMNAHWQDYNRIFTSPNP